MNLDQIKDYGLRFVETRPRSRPNFAYAVNSTDFIRISGAATKFFAMKTKTTITFETRQLTIVRKRTKAGSFWCERCSSETEALSPAEAAGRLGCGENEVSRMIETGELHFIEMPNSALLICGNSLAGLLRE